MSIKQLQKHHEDKIAALSSNPILFLQVSTLKKLFRTDDALERETFDSAIDFLSNEYYYVGEFLFEAPQSNTVKTSLGPMNVPCNSRLVQLLRTHFQSLIQKREPVGLEINKLDSIATLHTLDKIDEILSPFGVKIGAMGNHNIATDFRRTHKTQITDKYGTARRDEVRALLTKIFQNNDQEPLVTAPSKGSLNGSGQFSITFNLTSEGHKLVKAAAINNDELSEVTNGSLKRVIRRAMLSIYGRHPTDSPEAIEQFDSKKPTIFDITDTGITAKIPLNHITNGAFKGNSLPRDEIKQALEKELNSNLRLAAMLKHHPA